MTTESESTIMLVKRHMRAIVRDVVEGVQALEYTVRYYPSGTKHVSGTRLDVIVAMSRRDAVRDIICTLRHKSGEDFGDDPRIWIEKVEEPELGSIGLPRAGCTTRPRMVVGVEVK